MACLSSGFVHFSLQNLKASYKESIYKTYPKLSFNVAMLKHFQKMKISKRKKIYVHGKRYSSHA
jgi:hypothetical protein